VNAESAPKGAPGDLDQEVGSEFTGGDRRGAASLTAKQRRRFSSVTVEGILAIPQATCQAFGLATATGKGMRYDGTFHELEPDKHPIAVEVGALHRDRVIAYLGFKRWTWDDYVRQWITAGMAHRCIDLKRGRIRLLLQPATVCPVPMCGESLLTAIGNRGSQQHEPLLQATESVLSSGDASRGAEGDVPLPVPRVEALKASTSRGISFEIAACIRRERELGLADRDIAALLNRSEAFEPPDGFVHWTGYAIRVAIGEATYAA
jgi:hypothetical protein